MTPDQFRKLALAFAGATESSHMNHPDFRIAGKVFATLGYPDDSWGMVKLMPDQQQKLIAAKPAAFQPAKGAWGRQGSTLVNLAAVKPQQLKAALAVAVWNAAPDHSDGASH